MRPPTTLCHGPPSRENNRRGSAYVAVFGISLLVTTVGMGAMLALRSQRRAADMAHEEAGARAAAGAAVEVGLRVLATDSSWRSTYINGVYSAPRGLGGAVLAFKLVDETDGSLSNDALQPVRLYGSGRIGSAARIASVELTPTGPGLAVLGVAAYSDGAMTASGTSFSSDGPIGCSGLLTVSLLSTVNGNVRCGSLVNLGTITGTRSVGASPLAMPSASLFTNYSALGTSIPYSGVLSATIQKKVLGPGENPYGAADADGVYTIDVPTLSTLTIKNCRINATLVVSLGVGSTLSISGANAWDPPSAHMPSLIVKGAGLATVNIDGSTSPLSEPSLSTNFNPSTAPYFGSFNTTMTDLYPAELRGVFHIIGSGVSTNISSDALIRGACIAEGDMAISGGAVLAADPALVASPPLGYITPTGLSADASTWRREQDN